MDNQQAALQDSKQSNLLSESLSLEDLQDQNQISISNEQKQDNNLRNHKDENNPQNIDEPKPQKSFSNLQRELSKYKKLADERQLQLLKEQTKSREISTKLDAALSLNQKYEKELQLCNEKKEEKLPDSPPVENAEDITNTFSLLEKSMQSDADCLSQLFNQRAKLFEICNSYQKCLEVSDKQIQNLQNQAEYANGDDFSGLLDEILQIVQPEDAKEANQSPHDYILSIVKGLSDHLPSLHEEEEEEYQPSANGQILGHLENALYFIRTFKESKPDEQSSLKDEELREVITNQCKQIENFLKENKPEAVTSLFDNSNADDQINTFYDFIDSKKKYQSPFRELYALFTAAIEVNQMLFERNAELTELTQKSKIQSESLQKELNKTNSICDKKSQDIENLLDQMEKTLEQRPENILTGYHDVCMIIDELVKQLDKFKKEAKCFKGKYNKAKKSNDSKDDQIRTRDQQISEIAKEYKDAKQKAEVRNAELEAELQRIQNNDREKLDKVNKQNQKLQKLKDQNQELQTQLEDQIKENDELRLRIQNHLANEDTNASTLNMFENRVSKMKTKNADLKKQKNELETRLHNILEDMKAQNDSLEKSYQENLQQLKNENEELRNKLDEEQEANKRIQQKQSDYQSQAAKMKLADIQRATELNKAQKALQMSEQQSIAKLEAQKLAYEELIHKYEQNCDNCAQRIAILLDEDIDQIEVEDDSFKDDESNPNSIHEKKLNLNLIIDLIEEKIHPNIVRDAKETKDLLKLDKNSSIFETVKKLVKGMRQKDKSIKELEKNNGELKKITESISAEELENWKQWGNRQYVKMVGDELKPYDPEKVRSTIENVLNLVTNPQTLERKFYVLIKQKQILSKYDNSAIQKSSTEPIESIRVLMLAFMLIGRLRKYTQTVQLPYKALMNFEEAETENEEGGNEEEENEEEEDE